jgi:hypothetical protein
MFHEVEISTGALRIQARRSRSTRRKQARRRTFLFFDHTRSGRFLLKLKAAAVAAIQNIIL